MDWSWEEAAGEVAGRTRSGVNRLRSLMERVEYATEPEPPPGASETAPSSLDEDGPIFLVHGHDEGVLHYVARVVANPTGREVVILRGKANRGLTLLEKLEEHAEKAAYAVVLLTADDEGRAVSSSEAEPRARQNVVFELGLFFGLLGRDRVAVLYETNVELPTDLNGLVYIELDERGAWKQKLLSELEAAGIAVNHTRIP